MPRPTSHLTTVGALIVGAIIVIFSGTVTVPQTLAPSTATASSTLSVLPTLTLPSVTLPNLTTEASTVPPSIQKISPSALVRSITPIIAPVASATPALSGPALALRSALVNIICYAPINSPIRSITGSGVIISPNGIILTNAHVAQYFLLANRGVSCTIRMGSPAVNEYKASLMYISPEWVNANSNVLSETNPTGTGQYDFAFLGITGSASAAPLPTTFPYVPLATNPPSVGTPVTIASYAAQSLTTTQIESSLFPTIVSGAIENIFTFTINSIDLFSLGGSAAAQEGSSGGGVVNNQGDLIGTLTTSTVTGAVSARNLDAITASYIRAEYQSETGQILDIVLNEAPTLAVSNFASRIPALEAIITAHL
jgi:S1-C subfamily serine protease